MSDTTVPTVLTAAAPVMLPAPRRGLSIRPATLDDLPFMDALQKTHGRMVGWFPRQQMQGYIEGGWVLVAEESAGDGVQGSVPRRGTDRVGASPNPEPRSPNPRPLGYCIARDRYSGRDDVGIVYQLNVVPSEQRKLVGAALMRATFERAAYGCRLFCCWCAQDIAANHFWESIGYVPLAFRTGSRSSQRTHIFWQKRIREGDTTTPWWFPSQTRAGAVREERLVLPIPPGVHWRDAMPALLPKHESAEASAPKCLPGGAPVRDRPEAPRVSEARKMAIVRSASKHLQGTPPGKATIITSSGLRYIERGDYVPEPESKPARAPKPRAKNDPKLVSMTRELRDRYLEDLNSGRYLPPTHAKYLVCKAAVPDAKRVIVSPATPKLLAA